MFEFITISGGVAIVQHGATGHVYRFRPSHPGIWSHLSLDKVDVCHSALDPPQDFERAARIFAERAADACCQAAIDGLAHSPPEVYGRPWIAGRRRALVR